jgi:molybdopterin converting factor subunit 1
MKQIKVLFFATIRDHIGQKQIDVQVPSQAGVAELKSLLIKDHPSSANIINASLVSINHQFAYDDEFIPDGAEVAFFPHVSGG